MFAPVGTEEIIPRRSFPIVTAVIVAINVLFFIYEGFEKLINRNVYILLTS